MPPEPYLSFEDRVAQTADIPLTQDQPAAEQGTPLSGVLSPLITSFIAGVPKWTGERIAGMESFVPDPLAKKFRTAGDALRDVVSPELQADVNATQAQPWWDTDRGIIGNIGPAMAKIEAIIGDQLPMMAESMVEGSAMTAVSKRLLKLSNPYAKAIGAVSGIAAMTFMTAAPLRRRLEAVRDEQGRPLDKDIIDSRVQFDAPIEGAIEYAELLGAKGLGLAARAGGMKKAVAAGMVDKVESVLGRKAVAYIGEPLEEIAQGKIQQYNVEAAIRDQQARDPSWKPGKDAAGQYGKDEMIQDAVAAGLITGFFHVSGKAARLVSRTVDEDVERMTAAAGKQLMDMTLLRGPNGEPMKVMTKSAMSDISDKIYQASEKSPQGGFFKKGTMADVANRVNVAREQLGGAVRSTFMDKAAKRGLTPDQAAEEADAVLGADATSRFELAEHNTIYREHGKDAASKYLARIFAVPVVDDNATSKQAYDKMLEYYTERGKPMERKLIRRVDPDTGAVVLSAQDAPSDVNPFKKSLRDLTAVLGTGMTVANAELNQSLRDAVTTGKNSKWHFHLTRGAINDVNLLKKLTGIQDKEKLAYARQQLLNAMDVGKARFGKETKILYSFASYKTLSDAEAVAEGKGKKGGVWRASASNTVIDGAPVISLYHGFRNVGLSEDLSELLTTDDMKVATATDPVMSDAYNKLRAAVFRFNGNFLQTSKAFVEANQVDDTSLLATPEARKDYLTKLILDTASKMKSGQSQSQQIRTDRALLFLVGQDGDTGLYGKIKNHPELTAKRFESYLGTVNRTRHDAGLMTTLETIQSLRDMDPVLQDRVLTNGYRERFWKAVTLGMWGQNVFANPEEAAKYNHLQISEPEMQIINDAVKTLVGEKVFKSMVENPFTKHGMKFDLSQFQTPAAAQNAVSLTEPLPSAPVASTPSQPPPPTQTTPPPQSPPTTPPSPPPGPATPPTPPPAARPPRGRRTKRGTPPPAAPGNPVTPPAAGTTPPAQPVTPPAVSPLTVDEQQRGADLGWPPDADPDLVRDAVAQGVAFPSARKLGAKGGTMGFADESIPASPDENEQYVSATGDINAMSGSQLVNATLSQKSIVGRFAGWLTVAKKKALPTKYGEDLLYAAIRSPGSILYRITGDDDTLKRVKDVTVPITSLAKSVSDFELIPVLREHLNDGTLSQRNVRLIAKYFKDIRKNPTLYAYSYLDSQNMPVTRLGIQNRRQIVDIWTQQVEANAPRNFMELVEEYNGVRGLRNAILKDIRGEGDVILPEKAAEWLGRITAGKNESRAILTSRTWLLAYVHGQDYLSKLKFNPGYRVRPSDPNYNPYVSIDNGKNKTHSATIEAVNNLLYRLSEYTRLNEEGNAEQFNESDADNLTQAIFVTESLTEGTKTTQRRVRQSPLASLALHAMDFHSLTGSFISVTGDQGQSMSLRTQETDTVEKFLAEAGLKPEGNVITIDGMSNTIHRLKKNGERGDRAYERDLLWDDMRYTDRVIVASRLLRRGYVELGQMGDKTRGLFMRLPEMADLDSILIRDAYGRRDNATISTLYSNLADTLQDKYEAYYAKLHAEDKKAFVAPNLLAKENEAETKALRFAYGYYNMRLTMEMDADTDAMAAGKSGLGQFFKDGKLNTDVYGKRRSQGGTPGRALDDGKPIRTIAIDELTTKAIAKDPSLEKAMQSMAAELDLADPTSLDELFNGISFFMPKFSDRFEREMGSELSDKDVREDGLFGIKAHYRSDGKLIKVNWINLKKLADMGSPVFQDLYARLSALPEAEQPELIVCKQNGLKIGDMPTTAIWTDEAGIRDDIKPNMVELRSDRFYSPLSLNTDSTALHAKNAKQQEHNLMHLKGSATRAPLIAQYIAKQIPQWRLLVDRYLKAAQDHEIPAGITSFTNADRSIQYTYEEGLYVGRDMALLKNNPTQMETVVAKLTMAQASPVWLESTWRDLFGTKTDLIEMAMQGENPFGLLNARRTIPLLISKLERMLEVGGERVYAQVVSPGDHPGVSNMAVDRMTGTPYTMLSRVVANLRHADGSKPQAEVYFSSRESAMAEVLSRPEQYPWMFRLGEDAAPNLTGAGIRADQIEAVPQDGRVVYRVPGEYVSFVRIPTDAVPSCPVGSVSSAPDISTAAIMAPPDIMKLMGADQDGDQKTIRMLNKVNGKFVFDDTLPGIENRILLSFFQDALDPEQAVYWMQQGSKEFLSEVYQAYGHSLKETAASKENANLFSYLNTYATNNAIREANILSQRTVGIAAAMARFVDFSTHFGLYARDGSTLVEPLDADQAYQFKSMVTSPLINLTVDDPKDPLLKAMNLTPEGISLFITRCLGDGRLRDFATVTKEQKKAIILEHLQFLQKPKSKLYTELLDLQRYGIMQPEGKAAASAMIDFSPLFLRYKKSAQEIAEKRDWYPDQPTIMDLMGKGAEEWDRLHQLGREFQKLNRVVNVAMRDMPAKSVYEAARTIEATRGIRNVQKGKLQGAPLRFGPEFDQHYGQMLDSIIQMYEQMAALDVTARPEFDRLLKVDDVRFFTEEQFDRNMLGLRKRVVMDILKKQGKLDDITPAWLLEHQETKENAFLDSLISIDGKVALAHSLRGQLDVDTRLWDALPEQMQHSLFAYMLNNYGLSKNVSNGTYMSYVSQKYRAKLGTWEQTYMEDVINSGKAGKLVDDVLNGEEEALANVEETPANVWNVFVWAKKAMSGVFGKKETVVLPGSGPYLAKDQAKSDKATKFIGRGSSRSSTAAYAKAWGNRANSGNYTADDRVFVSAEGDRSGRVAPDFNELEAAVNALATVITDVQADRNRPYNVGEREVAAWLTEQGYVEAAPGEWVNRPAQGAAIGHADELIQDVYDNSVYESDLTIEQDARPMAGAEIAALPYNQWVRNVLEKINVQLIYDPSLPTRIQIELIAKRITINPTLETARTLPSALAAMVDHMQSFMRATPGPAKRQHEINDLVFLYMGKKATDPVNLDEVFQGRIERKIAELSTYPAAPLNDVMNYVTPEEKSVIGTAIQQGYRIGGSFVLRAYGTVRRPAGTVGHDYDLIMKVPTEMIRKAIKARARFDNGGWLLGQEPSIEPTKKLQASVQALLGPDWSSSVTHGFVSERYNGLSLQEPIEFKNKKTGKTIDLDIFYEDNTTGEDVPESTFAAKLSYGRSKDIADWVLFEPRPEYRTQATGATPVSRVQLSPAIGNNDEQLSSWSDDVLDQYKAEVIPALSDALARPSQRATLTQLLDDLPRLLAYRGDPDQMRANWTSALGRIGGVLGTASEPYLSLQRGMLERPVEGAGEPVEATTGVTPGVGMGGQAEAPQMSRYVRAEALGHSDERVTESMATFPVYEAGAQSIRSILVNESREAQAMREMAYRTGEKLRELATQDPHLLRVASFVMEGKERFLNPRDPVMDPWGAEHNLPAKYRNLTQTYLDNRPQIDAIIREAKDSFNRMRQLHNELLGDLSLGGYIKYLENYVPHMWAGMSGADAGPMLKSFANKHARERTVPTLMEGKEMGLRPKYLDIADLVESYADVVYAKAASKRMLDLVTTVVGPDGLAHVIPIYAGHASTRPSLLRNTAGNLMMGAGQAEPPRHSPAWSSLLDKFPKLIQDFRVKNPDYVRLESPYVEFDGFWVHPDSVSVMKNVLNLNAKFLDSTFIQTLEHVNTWSKVLTLGASLFHAISIFTGVSSSLGGVQRTMAWNGWRPVFAWNTKDFKQWLKDNPMFETDMVRAGMQYGRWLDVDGSLVGRDLATAHAWATHHNFKPVVKAVEAFQKYKRFVDKHLWRNLHAMSKIYLAYDLMNRWEGEALKNGVTIDKNELRRNVANYVNITAGGMDWNNLAWATPSVRKLMHLFIFAPDWTLSNIEIARAGLAGLPGGAIFGNFDRVTRKETVTRYWPALFIFSYVLPNMLQLMVGALTAGDDDDKEKKLLALQNEIGRTKDVDMTPVMRKMSEIPFFKAIGFSIDPTKAMERYYMSFSKQINEAIDWIDAPRQTLFNKTSMVFKIAFEQLTGNNTVGRALPFKEETLGRGFLAADGQFWESRAGYVLEKFVPMSIMAAIKDRPAGAIAPISKGMTASKTKYELTQIFQAYANPTFYEKLLGMPGYTRRLDLLAPEIIAAAQRNGVNVEQIATEALSKVRSKYQDQLFRGVNLNNHRMMEEAALAIVRLGGGMSTIEDSFAAKLRKNEGSLPPGAGDAVTRYVNKAMVVVQREEARRRLEEEAGK